MCGIIGLVGKSEDSVNRINGALTTLGKRGPDDRGVLTFPDCTIAQTRLSIIDLSSGHQPMKDAAADIAITFNGEIYNYKELRHALEQKGHRFVTQSDTEVILKAYLEYGSGCPEYLDGMFAFAIWDNRDHSLFMARDRFGEKPMYFAHERGMLIFASEIKAILATGLVTDEIDPVSLDNFLTLLYVPQWRSIYKEIRTLRPGWSATFKNGIFTEQQYWRLKKTNQSLSLIEASSAVQVMLTKAVESRLVADVEVGSFLSGGIDSSLVTMLAQQASSRPLKTFSVGFEDFINELPYAKEVAERAGTEHHEAYAKDDLAQIFAEVSAYFDEPFADSSNVPMFMVSRFASKSVKVALSGDGGDELFLGYGQYRKHFHLPKLQKLTQMLTGGNPFSYYRDSLLFYFSPAERKRLTRDPGSIETDPTDHIDYSEAQSPIEKINLTDFYLGLPGDMLTKVDRASMMNSLEVRSPFLDPALAELAYNLPYEYKSSRTTGKRILELAFADTLPDGFFSRKKQGFGAPVKQWLRKEEFHTLVTETLLTAPVIGSWLNVDVVREYVNRFYAGEDALRYKVWILLSLEMWARSRKTI